MIRVSEMVLPGHPDKFCDQVADAIVQACYAVDPQAYCQVEMSCWSDEIFLTGGIVTARPLQKTLEDIVRETGRAIGYVEGNAIDVTRYRIRNSVCQRHRPRRAVDAARERPVHLHRLGRLRRARWRGCRPSTSWRTCSARR